MQSTCKWHTNRRQIVGKSHALKKLSEKSCKDYGTKFMPTRPPNAKLSEDDIGDLIWAFNVSGIPTSKLATYAKAGKIQGAWNLGQGIRGWRFRKREFMAWLEARAK